MDCIRIPTELPFHVTGGGEPTKCVKSTTDMAQWQKSQAYFDLLGFINGISTSIQGKRISDSVFISSTMRKLLAIFDKLNATVDETPPIDQPQRFGNKAYRSWSRKKNHDIFLLMAQALPQEKCEYFSELGYYLSESFGNSVRIDYGTGHELSFLFFICALYKSEILNEDDNAATALRLFNSYLLFVRRLQKTYRMEPAGSHGVWSLDDYQFIPFIWGSAQLSYEAPFDPPRFLEEAVINEYKNEYMFIGCIDYICQVKTGHFAEHSNQLWSISAVPVWTKINSGLVKMYQKEVLSKFPIIQHVYFGRLMCFEPAKLGSSIPSARLGFPPAPCKRESGLSAASSSLATSILSPSISAEEKVAEEEKVEFEGYRELEYEPDQIAHIQRPTVIEIPTATPQAGSAPAPAPAPASVDENKISDDPFESVSSKDSFNFNINSHVEGSDDSDDEVLTVVHTIRRDETHFAKGDLKKPKEVKDVKNVMKSTTKHEVGDAKNVKRAKE